MATSQMNEVVRHLRRVVLPRAGAGLTDGQLLADYLSRRDEAALAALVRRHAPMVWRVCRRVLPDHHDAEDAFQATFLVLARRAASIASPELLANWLYGVAHQTALKARATTAKRRTRERQVTNMPEPAIPEREPWADLRPLLDQELGRLPAMYRAAIVLCDLGGMTRREAAGQLGVPEGTLAARLARGRAMLAKRLARRGLSVSGAVLASLLAHQSASANVPASVMSATIEAATAGALSPEVASLVEGVLRVMFLSKLKTSAATLVAICVMAAGGGFLTHWTRADDPAEKAAKKDVDEEVKGAGKRRAEVSGVVTEVDAAKGTVTLTGKPFGTRTYGVAKGATVLIDDGTGRKTGFREGKLADLAAGATATLRMTGARATLVYADGPLLEGTLEAADARAGTVTVAVPASKKDGVETRAFPVAEDAGISIDDGSGVKKEKVFGLADLTPGSVVTLKLSGDLKSAGSVGSRGQTVTGVFKAAQGGKKVTVHVREGEKTEDKTFDLARGARVVIAGGKGGKFPEEGKLADLEAGAVLHLRLSLDGKSVTAIQAEGATVRGILKESSADKRTVTVTIKAKNEPDEERTIELAKDAAVLIDGREGKFADLPAEARVIVQLSPRRVKAPLVHAQGGEVRGPVKGNASDDGITIGGKVEDLTFGIDKDARVLIEGKPGKVADLIDGSVVSATTSADRKRLVGTLHAEGPSHLGIVKSVDTANNKITLLIGSKNGVGGEEKTFALTKGTAVVTEALNVAREVSDLKVDGEVILRLTIDQKAAARITITGE